MSVLACRRNGCDNIMCDRFNYEFGYLCDECFEELIRLGKETNIPVFMCSVKLPKASVDESRDFFDNIFKRRDQY